MLEIYFFNSGHGDSALVHFPENGWGLIDCCICGYNEEPNSLKFLKRLDVKQLEFVCITHPHEDHYSGIDCFIDYFKKNIKQYILYGITGNDKEKKDTNSLGRSFKLFYQSNKREFWQKIKCILQNEKFNIENVNITCLNPSESILNNLRLKECLASNKDYNNASVVLLFEYAGRKILFNADAPVSVFEKIQADNDDICSDISKISHHGSKENNSSEILKLTNKNHSISIISSDGNIKYPSVPSEDVIKFLETEINSSVLKTFCLNNRQHIKHNLSSDFKIKNIYEDAASDLVCDDTDMKIPCYDGLIKVSIDNNGKIEKYSFNTLNEYFDRLNIKSQI